MREKKTYTVITFHTTAAAMAMEKYCGENEISGRLIPVPREISAGCGLAWRMKPHEYHEQQKCLEDIGIDFEQVVDLLL